MPADTSLLALAVTLVFAALIRRAGPAAYRPWPHRWAEGPVLPLLAGMSTACLVAWTWGGLQAPAVLHDEAAYLLQAELLLRGQLSAPGHAIPEAFTQAAVLVTPVVAPKMPPGHALVLLPGVLLGLPGLMPVVLAGATAAMLVQLVRQLWGPGVALVALVAWWTQAGQARWRASYLSESTTGLIWLFAWWCLIRWKDTRRAGWLFAMAASIGLGAISRPLTMLVFAIPVGVVVLRVVARHALWRDLAISAAIGSLMLGAVPLQNHVTMGDWRASPLGLYTRQYMPFDRMGFGLDTRPPLLPLSPELDRAMESLRLRHAEHTAVALPDILIARLRTLYHSLFRQWRIILIPAAVVGLFALAAPGWFALGTAALLYVVYLGYAHEPQWSVYYAEAMPIFAVVIAIGLCRMFGALAGERRDTWLTTLGLVLPLLLAAQGDLRMAKRFRAGAQSPFRAFERAIAAEGVTRGLIFVRHGEDQDPHLSLVRNVADPDGASYITAHDRGDALNAMVQRAFPDRVSYRYDIATQSLQAGSAP